jgi:hypothetical protein
MTLAPANLYWKAPSQSKNGFPSQYKMSSHEKGIRLDKILTIKNQITLKQIIPNKQTKELLQSKRQVCRAVTKSK